MTFLDVLNQVTFKEVQDLLLKCYPEEEEFLDDYKKVFLKIFQIQPKVNIEKWKITVEYYKEEFINKEDGEKWTDEGWDVYARKPKDKNHYAIEYTSWDEWLSMHIDNKTLKNLSKAEIIAHCLYEMTFVSFEQEDIQDVIEMVKERVGEIEEQLEKQKGEVKEPIDWEKVKQRRKEKENE